MHAQAAKRKQQIQTARSTYKKKQKILFTELKEEKEKSYEKIFKIEEENQTTKSWRLIGEVRGYFD